MSKFCSVTLFVNVDLHSFSGSLGITLKPKDRENFRMTAMLLFYTSQNTFLIAV
jgi:hypothetical protein